jgi:hypothetical protein
MENEEAEESIPHRNLMSDAIWVSHEDVGSCRVNTCVGKKSKASDMGKGKANEPSRRPRPIPDMN